MLAMVNMLGRTMLGIVTTNHCILLNLVNSDFQTMFVKPSNNMGQSLTKSKYDLWPRC